MRRHGFAMITTLWVMAVAGVLAAAVTLAGRTTVYATRNRIHLERAYWAASGCAARALAAIDRRLHEAVSFEAASELWRGLDRSVSLVAAPRCNVMLEAAGSRLDVNSATPEMLANLFKALGYSDEAPSLADAIVDWRDPDDLARDHGAERDWYHAQSRALPRNDSIPDVREIAQIRGLESAASLDTVLAADAGRVSLATASIPVLLSVPGFTRETAERLVSLRDAGRSPADVMAIIGLVSRESADAIIQRYADIVQVTTPNPDAWLLTTRAAIGDPPNEVALQWRLIRNGRRAIVVLSRSSL